MELDALLDPFGEAGQAGDGGHARDCPLGIRRAFADGVEVYPVNERDVLVVVVDLEEEPPFQDLSQDGRRLFSGPAIGPDSGEAGDLPVPVGLFLLEDGALHRFVQVFGEHVFLLPPYYPRPARWGEG